MAGMVEADLADEAIARAVPVAAVPEETAKVAVVAIVVAGFLGSVRPGYHSRMSAWDRAIPSHPTGDCRCVIGLPR
jgi:hypothetical protein